MSKPVAWITEPALIFLNNYACSYNTIEVQKKQVGEFSIPLYTHPHKQLSDEEIEQIAEKYLTAHAQFIGAGEVCYEGEIEFAKAIIKEITNG